MQEEIEQKSFNIMISTTKLSARTVLRAVKAALRLYQSKASQGKQSVRTLLRQNRGVSSVEISKTGIRGLERYAKKYGIDYAIRKDSSEVPPRYLVFFKAPDAEAFNSAFKEYSASLLNKDKRPSVLAKLHELVQAAAQIEVEKPFPQEEELAEKSARLAELNAQLDVDEKSHEPEQDEEEQEDEPRRPSVLAALEEKSDKPEPVKPFRSYYDKDGDAR